MVKQATAPNEAPATDAADATVSKFLDAVWMERGLSANTLAAYRADLTALARWLAERGTPIIKTTDAGYVEVDAGEGGEPAEKGDRSTETNGEGHCGPPPRYRRGADSVQARPDRAHAIS